MKLPKSTDTRIHRLARNATARHGAGKMQLAFENEKARVLDTVMLVLLRRNQRHGLPVLNNRNLRAPRVGLWMPPVSVVSRASKLTHRKVVGIRMNRRKRSDFDCGGVGHFNQQPVWSF